LRATLTPSRRGVSAEARTTFFSVAGAAALTGRGTGGGRERTLAFPVAEITELSIGLEVAATGTTTITAGVRGSIHVTTKARTLRNAALGGRGKGTPACPVKVAAFHTRLLGCRSISLGVFV
jgi:hypothetical protein